MISHNLKTIFIHIPRTAGNSISFALRQYKNYENNIKDKHRGILYFYNNYGKEFNNYYKFSCVRNPFEKVYSHYYFKLVRQDKECIENDFNQWVLKTWNNDITGIIFKSQFNFISIKGIIKIDYIMRYENLKDDFEYVCKKLKIKSNLKYLFPSCKEDYRKIYNNKSIEIISNIFKKDLEIFNYKFGE